MLSLTNDYRLCKQANMRNGQSAKIHRGPYKGNELSVEHIIPLAVAPELDKVIANLELMPLKMNEGKTRSLETGKSVSPTGCVRPDC